MHDAEISERYLKEKFAHVSGHLVGDTPYQWQGGTLLDDFYDAECRLARLFARHWKEATDE